MIKYAPEIFLKGLNRRKFEDRLLQNIREVIKGMDYEIIKDQMRWFISGEDINMLASHIRKVFGVTEIFIVKQFEADFEIIKKEALEYIKNFKEGTTFKVVTNRANKEFPHNSMETSALVGAHILKNTTGYNVDVRKPDVEVKIEIRKHAYLYTKKIEGVKGMPYGMNGSTMLMLSGGIDSPVAGYLMARRGVTLNCIYYHSHPYTSEMAKEKVVNLAKLLKGYTGKLRLIVASFTDIQMEIIDKCPQDELTIIMRRFMMRLACEAAKKYDIQSVTTGESVGQVASQTMEALVVSDDVSDRPVFRPLIAMDKTDIMDLANEIGTYETSILPYEDCCTIFVPKHPKTKPRLKDIIAHESALDIEKLVKDSLEGSEVIEL